MSVVSLTHLQIMYSIQTACCTIRTFTDHVLYSIQSACHTTLAFTDCVLYSIQTVIPLVRLQIVYCTTVKLPVVPHTFADLMYCTAVKLPVVTFSCVYRSCTAFKLPVIPLSCIYTSCTALKLPVIPLSCIYISCTALKLPVIPHIYRSCTAFKLPVIPVLCIYRLCTVQQSNCLSHHSHIYRSCTAFKLPVNHTTWDQVQQSNCLSIIPLEITCSSQTACHTTRTFTDHVHAATVWQLPFSPLKVKQFAVIFSPFFYSFFGCFHEQVTNKTGMLRALTVASIWHLQCFGVKLHSVRPAKHSCVANMSTKRVCNEKKGSRHG